MELTECGEKDGEELFFLLIKYFYNTRTNNPTFLLSGQLTGESELIICRVITIIIQK